MFENSTVEQNSVPNFEQEIVRETSAEQEPEEDLAELLKQKEQEYLETKSKYQKQQMQQKLPEILDLMMQNNTLIENILSLKDAEMKFVFKEIFKSEAFANAFKDGSALKEFRERKQTKSKKSKSKNTSQDENSAPQNVLSNETEDVQSNANQGAF
ncbi:MAG: hypothetical protein NC253_10650 [Ruminococcus sp.]|nr:hypothetical protein [Ruminococcus sp.]